MRQMIEFVTKLNSVHFNIYLWVNSWSNPDT
jgi:hypothetical protein